MDVYKSFVKSTLVCLFCVLAANESVAYEGEQIHTGITGRIEIEPHDIAYTIKVFLKNETDKEIHVIVGAGGSGKTVAPTFSCGDLKVIPPQYLMAPRRSMRPDSLTLDSHHDILYDSYTLGYPPLGSAAFGFKGKAEYEFTGNIIFRDADSKTGLNHLVSLKPAKLTVPEPKSGDSTPRNSRF